MISDEISYSRGQKDGQEAGSQKDRCTHRFWDVLTDSFPPPSRKPWGITHGFFICRRGRGEKNPGKTRPGNIFQKNWIFDAKKENSF
jgi:hypothetical protein